MSENRCINNLLKLICLLQENSVNDTCKDSSCTRPYLGPVYDCICYNTRPISIYIKDGSLFTINTLDGDASVFRIEKVNDGCVTLRALINNNGTYLSTNSFVTVNINCICVVRCHDDVVITNL